MKIRPVLILALGCMAATGLATDKLTKQFQSKYDRFVVAFMKSDWAPVRSLVADDFSAKSPDGKSLTWDQVVTDFSKQRAGMLSVKWVRKVRNVKIEGNSATVIVDAKLTAKLKGNHDFVFEATSKDLWVKKGSDWKLKTGDAVKAKMTMDGKPMKGG